MTRNLRYFLFFLGLALLFYWKSFLAFFQGDEWYYFTKFLPLTGRWYGIFQILYESVVGAQSISGGGHLTPIYNGLWFLFNKFFGLHFWPYIAASIFLHASVSFLVFLFAEKLFSFLGRFWQQKGKLLALVSGIFFAISSVHQQAVVWVMTSFDTQISVLFVLLSMIFLLDAVRINNDEKLKHYTKISFSYFLLALLTKETAVVLFAVLPAIVFLFKRALFRRAFLRYYLFLVLFYLPYRIGIPKFYSWIDSQIGRVVQDSSLSFSLFVFRAITYPLKMLAEIFIPSGYILNFAEYITQLAYPTYAAEKAIRGFNFLIFTQTGGSDMIIYVISILILVAFFYSIKRLLEGKNIVKFFYSNFSRQTEKQRLINILLIALLIIVSSSLPLILIAIYAPWWGYVTFIDSRHFYIASVGASILFSLVLFSLSKIINQALKKISFLKKVERSSIVFALLLVWGILNYYLLQQSIQQQAQHGRWRKTIVNTVLSAIPENSAKKAILVESNTPYYGFASIPPFQTNLGQILSVYYYQKRKLPEFFINSNFLSKNGIGGEGYKEFQDYGFGYFILRKSLLSQVIKGSIDIDSIFTFLWEGKSGLLFDTTWEIRSQAERLVEFASQFKNWNNFGKEKINFSFKYPADFKIYDYSQKAVVDYLVSDTVVYPGFYFPENPDWYGSPHIRVKVWKKPESIGLPALVPFLKNSDNDMIESDFVQREIEGLDGSVIQAYYSLRGGFPKYFVAFPKGDMFVEIEGRGVSNQRRFSKTGYEEYNKEIEKIISTISFNYDKK